MNIRTFCGDVVNSSSLMTNMCHILFGCEFIHDFILFSSFDYEESGFEETNIEKVFYFFFDEDLTS